MHFMEMDNLIEIEVLNHIRKAYNQEEIKF